MAHSGCTQNWDGHRRHSHSNTSIIITNLCIRQTTVLPGMDELNTLCPLLHIKFRLRNDSVWMHSYLILSSARPHVARTNFWIDQHIFRVTLNRVKNHLQNKEYSASPKYAAWKNHDGYRPTDKARSFVREPRNCHRAFPHADAVTVTSSAIFAVVVVIAIPFVDMENNCPAYRRWRMSASARAAVAMPTGKTKTTTRTRYIIIIASMCIL